VSWAFSVLSAVVTLLHTTAGGKRSWVGRFARDEMQKLCGVEPPPTLEGILRPYSSVWERPRGGGEQKREREIWREETCKAVVGDELAAVLLELS
jgi:hypothetical protein